MISAHGLQTKFSRISSNTSLETMIQIVDRSWLPGCLQTQPTFILELEFQNQKVLNIEESLPKCQFFPI